MPRLSPLDLSTLIKATWWEQLGSADVYYRCKLPAKHLPGVSQRFDFRDLRLEHGEPVFPRQKGSVAFWQFSGSKERAIPMAAMQDQGVKVLMEADDNYLIPFPAKHGKNPDWVEGLDDPSKHSNEAHRRITRFCDGIVASTPWLAEQYREFNPNVFVARNAVDPDDWPAPQPYDGTLRIGWAASDSHLPDAPLVRRALQWASKQPDVQVILYGNLFRYLAETGQWRFKFKHVPWTNTITEYYRTLGFLDVALCPVKDNQWSRAKSDVKALEASMAGALPIVSKAEAYKPWWETKMPCLVCETSGGFEEAVRWCVQHRDEVQEMAQQAREYVLTERSYPDAVEPWRQAVETVTAKPELVCA